MVAKPVKLKAKRPAIAKAAKVASKPRQTRARVGA